MAVHIDRTTQIAKKTLEFNPLVDKEINYDDYEVDMKSEKAHPVLVKLGSYNIFIRELMLSRGVDNYLAYISELLFLIFKSKPEMLKSNEQITIETILHHSSMDDLLITIAEKKVHELSYQGLKELALYLKSKFGLILFQSQAEILKAIEIIEIRNLIIHNRGVINNIYLKKTKSKNYEIGQKLDLSIETIQDYLNFLANSVQEIDSAAIDKFSLKPETNNLNIEVA